MHRLMPAVTLVVAAVAVALLIATSVDYVAYATTGRSLILGQLNVADTTTAVKNTGSGPAMTFKVKRKTAAPFAVNASGRVIRLNADKVDGLDSLDLAPLAVGVIDSSGDLLHGRGITSVVVDPTSQQYFIDLDGADYRSDRFTTVVTTTCAGVVARTTSSSGSLVVALQDSDLAPALCQFGFVTYAL